MTDLLTPEQLAERLSVPTGTLAQWRYLRKGPPFVKVGKHVRYRVPDIDEWLAAQAIAARPATVGVSHASRGHR